MLVPLGEPQLTEMLIVLLVTDNNASGCNKTKRFISAVEQTRNLYIS